MNHKLKSIIERIQTSDIGRRMASGAFWSFTGNAVAKVVVLVAGIVCAHILSKEQYGEFGMVRSTINMFVIFGTAGLGMTATKYIAEFKNTQKERVGSIYCLTNGFAVVTGLFTTICILFFSKYLASVTLHAPHLVGSIRVGALLLFVTVMNGAQNGVLLGFENYKARAINTLFGSIAEAVFMLLGAYLFGVFGAILGYGLGYIVLYLCNLIAIRRDLSNYGISKDYLHIKKRDLSLLYKFSIPAALSSVLVGPAFWVSRTILVRANGFSELAIYEAANYWNTIILFLPAAVSQIILPILSSIPKGDTNKFWKVLNLNLCFNMGITFILVLGVSVLSPYLMASYGDGYRDSFLVLIVLVSSAIFSVASNVVGNAIVSKGKMWMGLLFNSIWALLFILFSWLFIKNGMGSIGISLALLLSYFIHTIYQFIYLKSERKRLV